MRCPRLLAATVFALAADAAAQTPAEIRLWPGKAPGSETWAIPETTTTSPSGDRTIANVSDPSVTVFLPPSTAATGAAIVVAPGGALRVLGWDNEGVKVARWLNERGIAALVLKYRTLQAAPAGTAGRGAGARTGGPGAGTAPRQELEIRKANANPERSRSTMPPGSHRAPSPSSCGRWENCNCRAAESDRQNEDEPDEK